MPNIAKLTLKAIKKISFISRTETLWLSCNLAFVSDEIK
jgi:hypothetical protein